MEATTSIDDVSRNGAVSWAAILAGAVAAAATTIILAFVGSGLGLSAASPWQNAGPSITAWGVGAAIWLVVTQWLSSALGGFMAGRLRTKWTNLHGDERLFRDTAHGFLAWAAATLFMAAMMATAAGIAANGAATVAAPAVHGAAMGAAMHAPGDRNGSAYMIDSLFRSAPAAEDVAAPIESQTGEETSSSETAAVRPSMSGRDRMTNRNPGDRREAMVIIGHSVMKGELSADDRTYLGRIVAAKAGVTQQEALARIDRVVEEGKAASLEARKKADEARKAAAGFSLLFALSLVIGAFVASAAAALGGRMRDEY